MCGSSDYIMHAIQGKQVIILSRSTFEVIKTVKTKEEINTGCYNKFNQDFYFGGDRGLQLKISNDDIMADDSDIAANDEAL